MEESTYGQNELKNTTLKHKRLYQACDLCKERKIRCDLGPVDAPTSPPCKRCLRESKTCTFQSARKKRKRTYYAADPTVKAPSILNGTSDIDNSNGVDFDESNDHDELLNNGKAAPNDPCLLTNEKRFAASLLERSVATSYDALSVLHAAGLHGERLFDRKNGNESTQPELSFKCLAEIERNMLGPWERLRFVTTGLISAEEAMGLMEYFFQHLAPFTPAISSHYADPSHHAELLDNDPILALTILTISSRFMPFEGPGASTRSYIVHDTLWSHLQSMITHMIWGQENFWGVFSGPISGVNHFPDSSHRNCPPLGGLRTLGSCQALKLLTEWNPRVIHFPPPEEQFAIISRGISIESRAKLNSTVRPGCQFADAAWRSDRMCWSMLGNALTLATELGVYDNLDGTSASTREVRGEVWGDDSYVERANRVHHVLLGCLAQTSARLGRARLTSCTITEEALTAANDDAVRLWSGITLQLQNANKVLFRSLDHTQQIIRNNEYAALLDEVCQLSRAWKRSFDTASLSKSMRATLAIEHEYLQVIANSIALQALITEYQYIAETETLEAQPVLLLASYRKHEIYIKKVALAAKRVLSLVIDDLLPDDSLKHIPNRTYTRILTCAVSLWKTFALAISSDDATSILDLLGCTAKALQQSVVDDVHLSNRLGTLLEVLVTSLEKRRVTQMAAITKKPPEYNDSHGYISEIVKDSCQSRSSQRQETPRLSITTTDITSYGTLNSVGSDSRSQVQYNEAEQNQSDISTDPWLLDLGDYGVESSYGSTGWFLDQDMFNMLGPLIEQDYSIGC